MRSGPTFPGDEKRKRVGYRIFSMKDHKSLRDNRIEDSLDKEFGKRVRLSSGQEHSLWMGMRYGRVNKSHKKA